MTLHLLKPIDPRQTQKFMNTYNWNAHGQTSVSLLSLCLSHTLKRQQPVFQTHTLYDQVSEIMVATYSWQGMMNPLVFFSFLGLFLWFYHCRAVKLNSIPNQQKRGKSQPVKPLEIYSQHTVATLHLPLSLSLIVYMPMFVPYYFSLSSSDLLPVSIFLISLLISSLPLPPTRPQASLQHWAPLW